ncbi:MAG: BMP family protein [Candidatus Aureabacteria bacterium]|nr:BMP family protein [Candidatus Auribacterota bacterium]
MRRVAILLAYVCAGVIIVGMIGCSQSTPPEQKAVGKEALKVAAVFTTPIEEPWDGRVHQALLRAKKELDINYQWAESVPRPDYERVVSEFADRGFELVMGDAFGSEEAVRRVAKDYPRVAFCFGSGLGPVEPNFSVFDDWIHEPAYLCGLIAGKLTKSNVIGVVGGYSVPEVNRIINAFITGAKEVNPKASIKVVFINSWFDPPKAKEAAIAQVALGADVLFAERYGVIEAAKEKGVVAFGNMLDQSSLAPNTVVTSPVWDMWPTVEHVIKSVRGGTYVAMDYAEWSMMKKGGACLAPYHEFETKLSPEIKTMVEKKTGEIMNGLFRVPINEKIPVSD